VYDFLFAIIELFSLALTVDALQGKTCQNSLLVAGGGSVLTQYQRVTDGWTDGIAVANSACSARRHAVKMTPP